MIAFIKSCGRWLWTIVLAAIAITAVFLAKRANNRADRAHGRVADAAGQDSANRWKKIDKNLNAAAKAESQAKRRKDDAENILDKISAGDRDMRDLLDRYNSRRVPKRTDPS